MSTGSNWQALPEILETSATGFGDHVALKLAGRPDSGLTFSQLRNQVKVLATAIRRQGLQEGSPILLISESGPEWIISFFAILLSGRPAFPLSDALPLEVIVGLAKFSGASAAMMSDVVARRFSNSLPVASIRISELSQSTTPETTSFPKRSRTDLAVLGLTSGSTEHPRIVELSHGNLLSNIESFLKVRAPTAEDSMLSILPPTHLFELTVGQLVPLASGTRIVYLRAMLPNRVIDAIREERISYAIVVPGMLRILIQFYLSELVAQGISEPKWLQASEQELLAQLEGNLDERHRYVRTGIIKTLLGPTLKSFVVGGASMNPAWARILLALGVDLEVGYGLTEASPVVSLGSAGKIPPGSVGQVLPQIDLRISDDGEILLKGPNITRGYLNNAEATARSLRNGWLCTGDRGRVDADGFLHIEGRLKEAMVNEGGETIYPDELEPYYGDPLFGELCVAPMPGAFGNDIPLLIVVPGPNNPPKEQLIARFKELRSRLPGKYRVMGAYVLESPIPRTALGKPKRRQLMAQLVKGMKEPWNEIRQRPQFAS